MAALSAKVLSKRFGGSMYGKPTSSQKAKSTTSDSRLSTFETLPLEIRHLIFECFLPPKHRSIDLTAGPEKSWLGPLLRTSRLLNEEIEDWLDLPMQHKFRKSDQWGLIDPRQTKFTLVINEEFRQLSASKFDSKRAILGHVFAASVNLCDRIFKAIVRSESGTRTVQFSENCDFEHNRIHRGKNDRCKWYWLNPCHGKHIRHLEVTFATHDDAEVWRNSGYGSDRQQTKAWMSANGRLDNSIAAVYLVTPVVLPRLESVSFFLGTSDLWGPLSASVWNSDITNQPYWAEGRAVVPITTELDNSNFWLYPLVELEERRWAPTRPSYKLWDATRENGLTPYLIHSWPGGNEE